MSDETSQDTMTITEGLAEVKTILARIEKKRAAVNGHLIRDARLKDPMADDGGEAEYVRRERQAIDDLGTRLVAIRCAIQEKNRETMATVQGDTRSVAAWLTWRKEVAPAAKAFASHLSQSIARARQSPEIQKGNLRVTDKPQGEPGEVIVNLNEKALADQIEKYEHILGELDGKLSLLNATTTIDLRF